MTFRFVQQTGGTISYEPPTAVVPYQVEGDVTPVPGGVDPFDYIASYAIVPGVIPRTFAHPTGQLWLQDIQVSENYAGRIYTISAPYGRNKKESGAYQVSVDASGGTANVKAGVRTGGYAIDTEDIVDHGGLIGVRLDGEVEGVDIPIEQPKISVSFRHPQGILNRAYIRNIGRLVGYPNQDTFLGYEPGEVVYLGGPLTETETEATAQYSFSISYNATNLVIGGITVAVKAGDDVISPTYREITKDGHLVKELQCIETVAPRNRKSYVSVFGWGA